MKNNRRKLISVILLFFILFTLLSACTNKQDSHSGTITLSGTIVHIVKKDTGFVVYTNCPNWNDDLIVLWVNEESFVTPEMQELLDSAQPGATFRAVTLYARSDIFSAYSVRPVVTIEVEDDLP